MQKEFNYDPNTETEQEDKPPFAGTPAETGEIRSLETHGCGASSESGTCNAQYVPARDIQIDPALHERRAFSNEDLERAKAVVAQPHLIAPFPVVKRGNECILIDGFIPLQAVIALDPEARVKVREVDEEDALAERLADTRQRSKREPMVPARQALARYRAGVSQDAIARELGLSAGSVSQMVSAAEMEEECEELAGLIPDRSKLSRGFWFDLHTTRERLKKADENKPEGSSPGIDHFKKAIADMIAANKPISAEEIRKALGVIVRRGEPKRRNRMLGKPVKRRGLKVRLNVDRKRQGGKVINFAPGFPDEDFEAALEALLAFLMPPGSDADPAPKN